MVLSNGHNILHLEEMSFDSILLTTTFARKSIGQYHIEEVPFGCFMFFYLQSCYDWSTWDARQAWRALVTWGSLRNHDFTFAVMNSSRQRGL